MNDAGGRELGPDERRWLLDLARRTVAEGLAGRSPDELDPSTVPPPLATPGAAFVTLRRDGRLLGCIGSISPHRSLADDVAAHAYDAAFRDPRLPAVTDADAAAMTVEISVLGPLERLPVRSRRELAAALRPGVDGLWITSREGRGTFLPSVWAQTDGVDDFLDRLWAKAGLRDRRWPPDLEIDRYTVEEFEDGPEPGEPPARNSR
ncbi:MAG: AmmeMemoRadiSam system protein A [Acidimicrobiales bacterium]|jgi:hypothetical protein|nr:AmmeMemoRadiSam system protein A [Acidimicrobiales bacterium]